jgi:hypothetical protein
MTDDEHEYRRKNDVVIANLQTTFKDFIERYDRDLKDQNDTLEKIVMTQEEHGDFISDLKPIYKSGTVLLGAGALGSVGVAVAWFWHHIRWG